MRLNDVSIKWQLIVLCAALVIVPTTLLGTLTYRSLKAETTAQMQDGLIESAEIVHNDIEATYNLAVHRQSSNLEKTRNHFSRIGAFALDATKPQQLSITNQVTKAQQQVTIPQLTIGGKALYGDNEAVDEIEEEYDVAATVFQLVPGGMVRVATSVRDKDGNRAVGTYIPSDSPVYQAVARGETYTGRALVVDQNYITTYEPIRSADGSVIGSLFVGTPEAAYLDEMLNAYAQLQIGETGYVFIVDKGGSYVLSAKRERDGENVLGMQGSDGRYVIREMLDLAMNDAANEDTAQIITYDWKNVGEGRTREKTTAIAYVEEMGWVVGVSAYTDEYLDGVAHTLRLTILVCAFAIIAGTFVAYLFASAMQRRLARIVTHMNEVANGNLAIGTDTAMTKDEIGQVTTAFYGMVESIRLLVSGIMKNAQSAASSAEELSASAEEVNASVEQVSSTIQEIAKGAQQLSKNAGEASTKSKMTEESSRNGAQATVAVQQQMGTINETTRAGSDKVRGLTEKSKRIGNIIETINGISEQTNLLALNAAIEAARAGDAGRGFAVVADEVRKLAEESKKATALIQELINSIQEEIGNSVDSMRQISTQVDNGAKSITQALAAFEEVPLLVNQVNKSITDISAVAEENAAGAEEVSASVEEVTSAMQQVAQTAQQLAHAANELKNLVTYFKLEAK